MLEDDRQGVQWHVDEDSASIEFVNIDASVDAPWLYQWPEHLARTNSSLRIFPRTLVTASDIDAVRGAITSGACALLIPKDVDVTFPADVPVLRCPDRLADLDKAIEAKLLASRIARA